MREHALKGVPMRRWRRMMGSMHHSYSLSKRYSVVLRYLRPNGAENDVCPLRQNEGKEGTEAIPSG
ncbi:hypothetical protein J27TS7_01560 [Paenibacillus dendritiformis]|nr:hypothetical protein J27TS7_01560 [Paenibacillus dendritiformis]